MLFNRRGAVVLASAASVLTLGLSTPALATTSDFHASEVKTVITGGNSTTVAACTRLAKGGHKINQVAQCDNIDSTAIGGNLTLTDVNVKVIQKKSVSGFSNVDTTIKGGDAKSISECIAAASSGSSNQTATCKNVSSTAIGGDVTLNGVTIDIKTG